MADLSGRRVVAIAAIAGALVGGAVAGVVAAASASGNGGGASISGGGSSLATAAVVRTTLINTVQVGGSIGYGGSYTIAAPSGTAAQQITQAQEAVSEDEQALAADEKLASDASSADSGAVAADQRTVNADRSTLKSDEEKAQDCREKRPSSRMCSEAGRKVSEDKTQLGQAEQQLSPAQSTATLDYDQNSGKVGADRAKLEGDQATLASLQATAANPGTTFTSLPQAGDVIRQDQSVYSVSNQPVPLLYGSVAAYRAFYVGMSDGADVGQLTHDLIVLGYGEGLTESNHYSSATAAAVKRWQGAHGQPETGKILLGEVVFEPGPIRVTSVTPSVGAFVGGGGGAGSGGGGGGGSTVLSATSITPIVSVDLDVSDEYLVKPGDAVSIVLPNGTSTVGGHIETVGNVATCPGGGGTGLGGSSTADQSPCESAGSGNSSTPTVTVTITLDRSAPGASLDQAPVNVNITTQRANDVLAVPVNALLALQGGGFGVDVVTGTRSHLVGVTTGLYSNTLVQVSGSGIATGTKVEVPSS